MNRLKTLQKIAGLGQSAERQSTDRGYFYSILLNGVNDPFNGEDLWHIAMSFSDDDKRIKKILNAHAYRHGRQQVCFCHLLVELSANEVADDCWTDGNRSAELAADLVQHHLRDLGAKLPPGKEPRYRILAADDLAADQVRIRFGHTVYVDAAEDQPGWLVEWSADQIIWQEIAVIQAEQRLTMLGGSTATAPVVLDPWPFAGDCSVVLLNKPNCARLEVYPYPRGRLAVREDPLLHCQVLSDPDGNTLFLKTTPLRAARPVPLPGPAPAPEPRPIILESEESEEAPAITAPTGPGDAVPETFVPTDATGGATYEPCVSQAGQRRISLIGIAILRISPYRGHGVSALSFGFSADKKVVPAADPASRIAFRVDDRDAIWVETSNGSRPVVLSERLPLPGAAGTLLAIEPAPGAMAADYLGLCLLPQQPIPETISPAVRLAFGRTQPFLEKLRILAPRGYLTATPPVGGDQVLSRKALALEADSADGLTLSPESATQDVWLLDDTLANPEKMLPTGGPKRLGSGRHFVVGHYLFRFDAPQITD